MSMDCYIIYISIENSDVLPLDYIETDALCQCNNGTNAPGAHSFLISYIENGVIFEINLFA